MSTNDNETNQNQSDKTPGDTPHWGNQEFHDVPEPEILEYDVPQDEDLPMANNKAPLYGAEVEKQDASVDTGKPGLTEEQKAEILPRKYGLSYNKMINFLVMTETPAGCYMGADQNRQLPPRTAAIRVLNLCLKAITADGKMEQPGRVLTYREIELAQYILECSRSLDKTNDPTKDAWLTGAPVHKGEFYAHFGQSREAINRKLGLPPGSPLAPNYRPPTSEESINKVLGRLEQSLRRAKNPRAKSWDETPARHYRWGMNRCFFILHSIYNRDFGGFSWNDWSNYEADRPYNPSRNNH